MRIGVFDSGIGGLTVLHAIREAVPGHDLVYLGDTARIPYGTPVTRERLAQIAALEEALHGLGFRQVRVRHHGELARVEVSKAELSRAFDLRDELVLAGKGAGYTFVTLDLAGYRTGSLNELLRVLG